MITPSMHIYKLHFSTRTHNALQSDGIYLVGDLIKYTPTRLLRIRNLGKKSLLEVDDVLANHGMKLAGQPIRETCYRGNLRTASMWCAKLQKSLDVVYAAAKSSGKAEARPCLSKAMKSARKTQALIETAGRL